MENCYENNETALRGYLGLSLTLDECRSMLQHYAKNKLTDKPELDKLLNQLRGLESETGFNLSKELLIDIQRLSDEEVDVQEFRIGEAVAEVMLENYFCCRFYWNIVRDARNPRVNQAGADLVGFIEYNGEVLFLFGEVKTSSEQNSPPQVMTQRGSGMATQLKDLYLDRNKRLDLIRYLQSKIDNDENFKQDFNKATHTYYKPNNKYQIFGVLIRDTGKNELDLKNVYLGLKKDILEPTGLKLLAVYMPIKKDQWLKTLNEKMI
jgi:hypothetical protein